MNAQVGPLNNSRMLTLSCNLTVGAVSFEEKDQFIVMHMQDNGCGIPQEKISQLFEPFARGLDKPGEEKNSGLGLWISRSVIELHKGHIWCNSEIGKGTVMSIALPKPQEDI